MEEITQPTPQTPPPPKNNSGILIGIMIFVLGILIGLALSKTTILSNLLIPYLGAKLNPTVLPAPTTTPIKESTCTTCVDTTYNLSFEVPAGHTGYIHKQGYWDDYTILKQYAQPQKWLTAVGLSIFPDPYDIRSYDTIHFRNVGLAVLYNEHLQHMSIGETKIINSEGVLPDSYFTYTRENNTVIGGKTAMVFTHTNLWEMGPGIIEKLFFISNGAKASIHNYIVAIDGVVYTGSEREEIIPATLDQILSTFQFTQ